MQTSSPPFKFQRVEDVDQLPGRESPGVYAWTRIGWMGHAKLIIMMGGATRSRVAEIADEIDESAFRRAPVSANGRLVRLQISNHSHAAHACRLSKTFYNNRYLLSAVNARYKTAITSQACWCSRAQTRAVPVTP
jgi:hypothetical protein